MKLSIILAISFSFTFVFVSISQSVAKCDKGFFQEENGIVVFEAESISLTQGWALENTVGDYSGEGYITWTDTTTIETNGQGVLSYTFKITKPGTYTIKIRNYHSCEDFTEFNDVFLRMNDGDWRKNFNHTVSNWDWNSQQDIDHVFSNAAYRLEQGEHTLYLSGRSQNFSIDRIALYHNDTPDNAYKTAEPSKCLINSNRKK